MHLVPSPPGVESSGYSYCCDFGKSLLNPRQDFTPCRFYIDENYPRSYNDALRNFELWISLE